MYAVPRVLTCHLKCNILKVRRFAGFLTADVHPGTDKEGARAVSSPSPSSIAIEYYFLNIMFCHEQVSCVMINTTNFSFSYGIPLEVKCWLSVT